MVRVYQFYNLKEILIFLALMLVSFIAFIKFIFQRYEKYVHKLQNFVLLHVMYFVGIGLTSLAAKLTFKKFLDETNHQSTWKSIKSQGKITEMF